VERITGNKGIVNLVKQMIQNSEVQYGRTRIVAGRGVRQGSPLSPLLFNIALDPLLRKVNGELKSEVEKEGWAMQAFADDMAFTVESFRKMERVMGIIRKFSLISGLEINMEKSVIIPVGKLTESERNFKKLTHWKDMKVERKARYLGVIVGRATKRERMGKAITKLEREIKRWTSRKMNVSNRARIANIYLIPTLQFQLRFFWPGKELVEKLRGKIRKFVRGDQPIGNFMFEAEWGILPQVRDIGDHCRAMIRSKIEKGVLKENQEIEAEVGEYKFWHCSEVDGKKIKEETIQIRCIEEEEKETKNIYTRLREGKETKEFETKWLRWGEKRENRELEEREEETEEETSLRQGVEAREWFEEVWSGEVGREDTVTKGRLLFMDQVWTNEKRWKRGMVKDGTCERCEEGVVEDVKHAIFSCKGNKGFDQLWDGTEEQVKKKGGKEDGSDEWLVHRFQRKVLWIWSERCEEVMGGKEQEQKEIEEKRRRRCKSAVQAMFKKMKVRGPEKKGWWTEGRDKKKRKEVERRNEGRREEKELLKKASEEGRGTLEELIRGWISIKKLEGENLVKELQKEEEEVEQRLKEKVREIDKEEIRDRGRRARREWERQSKEIDEEVTYWEQQLQDLEGEGT